MKIKNKKEIIPYEFWEQCKLFEWAEEEKGRYPELRLLNGSLNGVKLTEGQSMKCKRTGMRKGWPDVNLPVARGKYHGLYIELKRRKGGVVSDIQREILGLLQDQGHLVHVCKGYREAVHIILEYLKIV